MKFALRNGNLLEIDLKNGRYRSSWTVQITGETDLYWLVTDQNGIEVPLHKMLPEINRIPIEDGRLALSEYLYRHHFGLQVELMALSEEQRLLERFPEIMANQDLVFERAQYYLIHADFLISGTMAHFFGQGTCLGGLLENWLYTDELLIDHGTVHGPLYLISFWCSTLSDTIYAAKFWAPREKAVLSAYLSPQEPSGRHGDLLADMERQPLADWMEKIQHVSEVPLARLPLNHWAIRELLAEIDQRKNLPRTR
jgi:hypothetical protein